MKFCALSISVVLLFLTGCANSGYQQGYIISDTSGDGAIASQAEENIH